MPGAAGARLIGVSGVTTGTGPKVPEFAPVIASIRRFSRDSVSSSKSPTVTPTEMSPVVSTDTEICLICNSTRSPTMSNQTQSPQW